MWPTIDPQQIKRLKEKRATSIVIIENAIVCCYDQAEEGGFIYWEWPLDADCHDLPMVRQRVDDLCLIAFGWMVVRSVSGHLVVACATSRG